MALAELTLAVQAARRFYSLGGVSQDTDLPPVTVPVVKLLFAAPLGQPLHFVPATPTRSKVAQIASGAGDR
jgi:hypothetical protein